MCRCGTGRFRREAILVRSRPEVARPPIELRTTRSGGLATLAAPQVVVWLARKDSNLRSPDPETNDPDRARGPMSVLRPTGPRRLIWGVSGEHSWESLTNSPDFQRIRRTRSRSIDLTRTDDDYVTSRSRLGL